MEWYKLTKLAFGAPLANNNPVLWNSPDITDKAKKLPGLGEVPSPFAGSKPGGKKRRQKKRRKLKRRQPGFDLGMDSKRPTDSAGSPRPTGDLTGG